MEEVINQADNWLNLVRLELVVHADNPRFFKKKKKKKEVVIALYERVFRRRYQRLSMHSKMESILICC